MARLIPVLVTGGAGYVGSHTCKALAHQGFLPIAYDNLERGHRWAVRWGPLEQGDIRDRQRLDEVLTKYRPQAVLHFAAYAYVGESVEQPDLYRSNNVVGSRVLLDALQAHQVSRLVFSSSCATYGLPERVPIDESQRQRPLSPYGESKLEVEVMLRQYASSGLRSISLRYFNAAGADPDGEIGEAHEPETHLVPSVLEAALGLRDAITLHGDDYPTVDGTCVRDYVHVTDLATAHVLALRALGEGGVAARAYNVGSGAGWSVKQIVAKASTICGHRIDVRVGPRRPGDPPCLVADPTRIRNELGWRPAGGLDSMIESAWRWVRRSVRAGLRRDVPRA